MKLTLLTIETGLPDWFEEISDEYQSKISRFVNFEVKRIKAKGLARAQAPEKKQLESQELINKLEKSDFVILFDEKGKTLNTDAFGRGFIQKLEGGVKHIVFVVGGAYGASEELKQRANQTWKLSDLTMNHLVAQIVGMEQIYRSLTIWKGVPYHNE